jgi:hypothetical protein
MPVVRQYVTARGSGLTDVSQCDSGCKTARQLLCAIAIVLAHCNMKMRTLLVFL